MMRRSSLGLCSVLFLGLVLGTAPTRAQTVPAGFSDALVMGGWTEPVGFTFDANNRMYVWEKSGKVWIVENGVRLATPLIDISPEVGNWRDHGCLGFTLDPNFLTNGRIYLLYAVDRHHLMNFGTAAYNPATDQYFSATIMRVTRYTAIGPAFNTVDPNSRVVLIGETKKTGVPMTHESHSTGSLVFGTDGTLLVSTGDGASYNATDVGNDAGTYFAQALSDSIMRPAENVGALRSQLLNCMNGKVLRIDPNTGNGVPSNPFYDAAAPRAPKSRVWAMGLRNPYRMTLRPNSGSSDPAAADPGTLYIGDVGWNAWEDLNVCYEGGMNFGWPLFEGMEPHSSYQAALTPDLDAPNPLFGQGGCTQQYFNFQDLVKQETPVHLNAHPNPCDASVQIPANIHTSFHARPAIDWQHGNRSRCGGFSGNTAVTFDLDAVNSPVPGPRFGGNASVGGAWITGTGWPVGYQNTYFHADYGGAWVRRMNFDADDKPLQVFNFGTNMGAVVFLKQGPDGALWYVRYETGQIRKVSPLGATNLPPIAVAQQNVQYGPGPLSVDFSGSGSSDPENGPLTYLWQFGDGQTSTAANPTHVFSAPAGVPTSFTVTLTVRDDQNQPNSTTLLVSVNNTPPNVQITSFPSGHRYPVGVDTTYALEASVSDAEHGAAQLTYSWYTIFHHNNHVHPEPVDHAVATSTVISGLGCYEEEYYYEVRLTVTDAGGLSTTAVNWLYPRCSSIAPTAAITSTTDYAVGAFSATLSGANSVDNGSIVSYAWDFGDGTTASGVSVAKNFTEAGDYQVTLRVTDNDGLVGVATKVISVLTLDPPQCVGAAGSILREYWSNVGGATVNDLLASPNYPNTPSGSSFPTQLRGPVNFADNFGTRMRGYIIAPETGDYRFTVTSDDNSAFYLSLNADPQYKRSVCYVPGYTGDTEYSKYATQRSAAIPLQAGKYYYFEFLHKEGGGGDHLTIRWERPSDATLTIVPGSALARWQDCGPSVKLRAILQGPYDTANGLMRDDLRAAALVPPQEPFTGLGFTHLGGGGEIVPPSTLAATGKNAVVDWVLVELRNKNNPAQILATRSVLLQRDGDIVAPNGQARLLFNVPSDNYYIAVRHRNHLGVMTATARPLNRDAVVLDLTSPATPTYGTAARRGFSDGRQALWMGNVLRDAQVKYTGANNDRDPILVAVGGSIPTSTLSGQYRLEDVNMDGVVKYTGANNDRDPVLQVIGGAIPTAVKPEQLP